MITTIFQLYPIRETHIQEYLEENLLYKKELEDNIGSNGIMQWDGATFLIM